jgi:hypothetical protein
MTPTLFLIQAGDVTTILCEDHAKVFEQTMMVAGLPHTIIELEDSDTGGHECHACNLKETIDEMSRPKIIMPGDYQ